MSRRHHGFTIIELMIVVSVIVILALLAIPSLIAGRLAANEVAAIGTGEYGGLGELGSVFGVRGGTAKVPTDLAHSMGQLDLDGAVTAGSAFVTADPLGISGRIASGETGADGNIWRAVQ